MRVAVTGGTGFLGAHITKQLLDEGHEPVCLVRPTSDRAHLDALGVTQIPGSLADVQSLTRLVREADAVVHAAGTVASWNKAGYHLANTQGTKNLVLALDGQSLERLIYVSSLAAKGPSPTLTALPATSDPRPVSTYGESKLGGERAVRIFAREKATTTMIVRPPALYGPGDRRLLGVLKAAKRGIYALFLPDDARLSLLHGEDCARIVTRTLQIQKNPAPAGEVPVYEPADGPPHDNEAIRQAVMDAAGAKRLRTLRLPAPVIAGAARAASLVARTTRTNLMLNPDKVKELRAKHWLSDTTSTDPLDWEPRYSLGDGMRATKQWYEQEGWI